MTDPVRITAVAERFPVAGAFTISRGSRTHVDVIVATATDGRHVGRGEAVPYARYGETVAGTLGAIAGLGALTGDRDELTRLLPAGAARNAVDCALVDLAARSTGVPAARLLGVPAPKPIVTCFTLSLDTPERMAERAAAARDFPLLKLKLGGEGDAERLAAIRRARPDARLVADANEAWTADLLEPLLGAAEAAGLELVEQPLPAGADDALARVNRRVPICADESFHTAADLDRLATHYDAVNVKLDKTGGITTALATVRAARGRGLRIMVGCMLATSLSMAPAFLIAADADWVDLDGPLLLAADRPGGLTARNGVVAPPAPELWGL